MPDAEVALERGERPLVEDLGDQPELAVHHDPLAVGDGHPGRFLPPMLECEEPEEGQSRHVLSGRPHPEEAAGFARAFPSHRSSMVAPASAPPGRYVWTCYGGGPCRSGTHPPSRAPRTW